MDLSSWMLKGSILTSGINSERIPFQQNTLTISQNHGPWTPMVYYRTLDASMFWIPEISNSMFFSTHTITLLQDISVRQRHSTKSACTTIGLDFLPISMDFIEKLPPSSDYTTILVIVDHLSKQSLLIPTHDTIMSLQLAQLFILHVFSKHGVPSHITSNHSMEFVSHFFQSLGTTLDMKLHFTSGYHPKGDGQTK